jgi:hypothetical protein
MNAEDKVKATENAYTKSMALLEEAIDGGKVEDQAFKAAIAVANGHIKLMNIVKGTEALSMARQRYDLDWSTAYAESKKELRQLLDKKVLK